MYKDFFQLLENKDHLISKLDLTDEQRDQLKAFFKKYPNYESKIDWNRKDLSWEDFSELLDNEGKSKSQAKKYGLSGLKEGTDYLLLDKAEDYTIYYPLTFKASETLANAKVEPKGVTGKWCISGGNYGPDNGDKYWKKYTLDDGYDFFFVFTDLEKYAIARNFKDAYDITRKSLIKNDIKLTIFDSQDRQCKIMNSTSRWYSTASFFTPKDGFLFLETPGHLYLSSFKEDGPYFYKNHGDISNPQWSLDFADYFYNDTIDKIPEKYSNYHIIPGTFRVGSHTFTGRQYLKELYIPASIEDLGAEACRNCTQLTKVIFEPGSKLDFIRNEVFANNPELSEVQLPEVLEVIQNEVFVGCKNLKQIIFPEALIGIGLRAFAGSGLIRVELPNSLQVITNQAFANMPNLEYVRLPASLVHLGQEIFKGSKNLKQIDFMGTQEKWDELLQKSVKIISSFGKELSTDSRINALTGLPATCKINILGK